MTCWPTSSGVSRSIPTASISPASRWAARRVCAGPHPARSLGRCGRGLSRAADRPERSRRRTPSICRSASSTGIRTRSSRSPTPASGSAASSMPASPPSTSNIPACATTRGTWPTAAAPVFDWFAQVPPQRVSRPRASRPRMRTATPRPTGPASTASTPGTLAVLDARGAPRRRSRCSPQRGRLHSHAGPRHAGVTIDGAAFAWPPGHPALVYPQPAASGAAAAWSRPAKRPGPEGPIVEAVQRPPHLRVRDRGARPPRSWKRASALPRLPPRGPSPRARLAPSLPGQSRHRRHRRGSRHRRPGPLRDARDEYADRAIRPAPAARAESGAQPITACSSSPRWASTTRWSAPGCPGGPAPTRPRRGGPRYAPEQYRLLSTFGDYILFKGSLANVVAEGRFDTNWKVPAADAAKMLATRHRDVH